MASPRRTLLFVAALAFAAPLVPAAAATAGPAQDTTGAFVGGPVQGETTTTVPAATTTAAGADTVTEATVVEEEPVTESRRVVTESRKVAAVIGALILVALLLMLLTVRYWRNTKPVAPDADGTGTRDVMDGGDDGDRDEGRDEPDEPSEKAKVTQSLDLDSIFTATDDEVVAAPVTASVAAATAASATAGDDAPGTDHESADDDWKPRTGEQERVELPTAGPARPTAAARRKALGISSDT